MCLWYVMDAGGVSIIKYLIAISTGGYSFLFIELIIMLV